MVALEHRPPGARGGVGVRVRPPTSRPLGEDTPDRLYYTTGNAEGGDRPGLRPGTGAENRWQPIA